MGTQEMDQNQGHHGHNSYHGHGGPHGTEIPEDMKQYALFVNAALHLFIFAAVVAAIVWGLCERQRRRHIAEQSGGHAPRSGNYLSGLFECIGHPRICIPAFFFTPILAAFNRAAADKRECSACDVCFSLKTPLTQYHTRQTVRSSHLLEDNNGLDCISSCCCTPCAVGQDALEIERRGMTPPAPPAVQIVVAEGSEVVMPNAPTKDGYDQVPIRMQV